MRITIQLGTEAETERDASKLVEHARKALAEHAEVTSHGYSIEDEEWTLYVAEPDGERVASRREVVRASTREEACEQATGTVVAVARGDVDLSPERTDE